MKKKLLLLFLIIILLIILLSCFKLSTVESKTVPQINSGKTLTFFVATDLHYLSKNLTDNGEALKVFQNCGLNLVLSGHIHVQDIKCNKSSKIPTYDIVTSALSVYPQQYGVIKYIPSSGFDYSTSKVNVENWAKASNINDNNLLNFKKYSKGFFELLAYNNAYNRLSKTDGLSDDNKKLMAKTMVSLNLKQFSGTMNEDMNEILNSRGYKLLVSLNSSFLNIMELDCCICIEKWNSYRVDS
jgi:hypothetical protein